jgi:hypothetical protein
VKFFVLDDRGNPIEEPDHAAWRAWWIAATDSTLTVRKTVVGSVRIRTLFLGIDDHGYDTRGRARVFYTEMVSAHGYGELVGWDYAHTRREAIAAHTRAIDCALVREGLVRRAS